MGESIETRNYKRCSFEAPITFSNVGSQDNNEIRAQMFNFSNGGMYFESNLEVNQGSDIFIKMVSIPPEFPNPENLEGWRAEVRWCREIFNSDNFCYGIGVRYIENTDNNVW